MDINTETQRALTSKTLWVGALTTVAGLVGHFNPTLGDFMRDNAVLIVGALGPVIFGLRTMTSQPVTFSVSKKL